jgi:hypothetical protein
MSGKSTSLIDSTHCINVAILHSRIVNDDYIGEEVHNSLDGQINTSSDPTLYRTFARKRFPAEFQAISNLFLFISPVGSAVEVTNDVRGTCAP